MKRHITILAAIGAITAIMAVAQTNTPATPAPISARARVDRHLMKSLDLTAAQKVQVKAIRQATKQQAEPLAQQLKQQRQALSAAVQAGDSDKIQPLSTQLGTLQGQVLTIRANGRAQFYALLTPDQKAKAAEFQQRAKKAFSLKGE